MCVDRFNRVSLWVASTVCADPDVAVRAHCLQHFIVIAKYCAALHNYASLMAILAALNLSAVRRLKKTWQLLPDPIISVLHSLETLMSNRHNYIAYRQTLKRIGHKAPCVPYLGLYLKDLVFINDGNPRFMPDGRVNFRKMWLVYDTLREMSSFKRFRRSEAPRNQTLHEFVRNGLPAFTSDSDNALYASSLHAEPRQ
eukprot:Unigene11893_Nuclearia_a/m.36218 Unigene11893_Nuclearia_a/g.36218  ORF Unigene11893_Nuclearia_a/g.36218 Unigene11893_Nuclearia_a/m.36218 type:complete len:198 (+) Unigene11893_Nuclearia_a:1022-1615(+)